jgi:hypothetical protein
MTASCTAVIECPLAVARIATVALFCGGRYVSLKEMVERVRSMPKYDLESWTVHFLDMGNCEEVTNQ